LPVYIELINQLAELGAEWVQLDEPYLVMNLSQEEKKAYHKAYETLRKALPHVKILLATYFECTERKSEFLHRQSKQKDFLKLPLLTTTNIGSLPQTPEIRAIRAKFKKGELSLSEYEAFIKTETEEVIRFQENVGLD
ncbi:uncharacterized protein LOC111273533, partial [Varroa jacobsoni]|uniref:uncharacterized protein LOC111273533 n=1 Tax=Varroa jacobsoni TaxID=62625 RepID=UPI000BF82D52